MTSGAGHSRAHSEQPREELAKEPLRLEGITKAFETDEMETHALSEVNLAVGRGEWVPIVGPSENVELPLTYRDMAADERPR